MITIDRSHVARRSEAPTGSWWVQRYTIVADPQQRGRTVSLKCPLCGNTSTLQAIQPTGDHSGHHIARDGVVTPSVVCPHKPCTWHEHITLQGWPAPKAVTV